MLHYRLSLNIDKCHSSIYTRIVNPDDFNYRFDEIFLDNERFTSDLGVVCEAQLNVKDNIETACTKASRM